jgi:subtilisin-like proprotein convertase family protein
LSGVVSNVAVSFTSGSPSHTFRGDIEAVLKAPGGTPAFTLFSRTGATSTTSFGSNADLTGPYTFTDSATGQNWWDVPTTPTPPGSYRTIMPGPSTTTPAVTSINAAFASVGNANGTWTLSFRDGAQTDTGTISAASLTLTAGAVVVTPQHVVDFNGDGKTDFALTRNTGGGASGQLTWFVQLNGGSQQGAQWGIASDSLAPGDFDGDNKTDYAVWRFTFCKARRAPSGSSRSDKPAIF